MSPPTPERTPAERERAIRDRVTTLNARSFDRNEACFLLFQLDEARATLRSVLSTISLKREVPDNTAVAVSLSARQINRARVVLGEAEPT